MMLCPMDSADDSDADPLPPLDGNEQTSELAPAAVAANTAKPANKNATRLIGTHP